MPTRKYHVILNEEQRNAIEQLLILPDLSKEVKNRIAICLELDEGENRQPLSVKEIASKYGVSELTVRRYRERFSTHSHLLRFRREHKYVEKQSRRDVTILSLYTSVHPKGKKWTCAEVANAMSILGKPVSAETIRRRINVYKNDPIFGKALIYLVNKDNEQRKTLLQGHKFNNLVYNMVLNFWLKKKYPELEPIYAQMNIQDLLSKSYTSGK